MSRTISPNCTYLILFLLCFGFIIYFLLNRNMTIPNGHDSIQTISHNGQHHHYSSLNNTSHRQIFLDFGCTDAIAIKVFLGLKGVSKDTAENGAAKSFEGKGADGLWEIYCVEALPRYGKILNKTIEELTNVSSVKSFSFFTGVAVSNKDGTTKLMYDTEFLERASYGNSILPEKHNYKGRGIDIKTYDIVTFMRDIVQAKQSDEVICKMDIEGSEYDVLRRIFTSGIIKLFDELYVEFHYNRKQFKNMFHMPHSCVQWMLKDVKDLKYHPWN
mmetsp:Transcript_37908/g.38596  ORF Transcript_37908/g.38596 Transcript_37908/m.38596 type:complete len:273 (+) Transcript_37908:105-923(+)